MESAAENETGQEAPPLSEIQNRFDEILTQHLVRLLDTPHGINDLPLSLQNISCIVLLAERETEIEISPDDAIERYAFNDLIDEVGDLVIDFGDDLQPTIVQMQEHGYLEIDEENNLTASPPTIDMSALLDNSFPTMPGLNFVAYLAQTMNEALSGRKDLDLALSQFDQVLHTHGAGSSTQSSQPEVEKTPAEAGGLNVWSEATDALGILGGKVVDEAFANTEEGVLEAKRRLQAYVKQTQSDQPRKPSLASSEVISQPRVVSQVDHFSFQNLSSESTETPDSAAHATDHPAPQAQEPPQQTAASVEQEQPEMATTPDVTAATREAQTEAAAPAAPEPMAPGESAPQGEAPSPATEPASGNIPPVAETSGVPQGAAQGHPRPEAPGTDPGAPTQEPDLSEEAIQQRIAAFEEDLASICPACKQGTIRSSQTRRGKVFYTCDDTSCNLISWGRPYHLSCPQCQSPFLIEAMNNDGSSILKCPRVTCAYRAPHPVHGNAPVQSQRAVNAPAVQARRKGPPGKRKVVRKVAAKGKGQASGKKKVRKVIVRKK